MADLSAEDFRSIISGLDRSQPKLKLAEIAATIQESVPHVAPEDARDIAEVLLVLVPQEEVTVDEFVTDLLESMRLSDRYEKPPALGWDGFREEITSLLTTKTLRVSSRADDIQHEHMNVFTGARILSDIRTVFDAGTVESQGALIIHQLKLTYFCNGQHQDIYISMDNADLKTLRGVVERAELKTDVLRDILRKASLTYFESA